MSDHNAASSRPRLFYLDNLRIYLTILVILHHTAIAYGGSGDWAVKDPGVDDLSPIFLTFFTAVNQSYFMSGFFLLAGYFTPRSLEKKGAGSFLADRLIRLGIPVLIYTTLIIQLNRLILGVWLRGETFRWVFDYSPGHLWFLQALLLFAVLYVLYRLWPDREGSEPRFKVFSDRFPPDRALIASIVLLGLFTFTVRLVVPVGEWIVNFQLAHFVHYTFSFFVGVLAYRGDWFGRLQAEQARRWGVVALVMLPLFFVIGILGGALEGEAALAKFLGGWTWQSLAYVVWESILFIAALTYLLHLFRTRFNQAGPRLRSAAANVYTVYIIHQTVVIGLNVLFLEVNVPTILKLVIVAAIAIPVCFALAGLIRKIPYAQRVLG